MGGYPSSKHANSVKSNEVDVLTTYSNHTNDENCVKLLLLGLPGSGKSTIFKQFRLLFGKKFDDDELIEHVPIIRRNIIVSMQTLIKITRELHLYKKIHNTQALQAVEVVDPYTATWTVEYGAYIKELWHDKYIQTAYEKVYKYQYYQDAYATKYFAERSDIISVPWYQPVPQDILICRLKTTGNPHEKFDIQGTPFQIIDVGGHLSERTKWPKYYDSINCIVYVINLSEYDLQSVETPTVNALAKALETFQKVCNSPNLQNNISIILFLNMKDLFELKLSKRDINDVQEFSDYTGTSGSYTEGVQYFLKKFLDIVGNSICPQRKVYHHTTCAVDTNQISLILNMCKDNILRSMLV